MLRKIKESISGARFVLFGKKPWSAGYYTYKKNSISRAIESKTLDISKLPEGFGHRVDERAVEYPWFFSRLADGSGNLLDAGSVLNYDFVISHKKLENKKVTIMTLAPEPNCFYEKGVSYIFGDLRDTCFKDGHFDFIASLSTIEHIGLDNSLIYSKAREHNENRPESYLSAVAEFRRILKKGGTLYLSVPYGKHKNYGWFQTFDRAMIKKIIDAFAPSSFKETYFQYKPSGWINSDAERAKDCECFDVKSRSKNYDSDFAAFSRAVACVELVK